MQGLDPHRLKPVPLNPMTRSNYPLILLE